MKQDAVAQRDTQEYNKNNVAWWHRAVGYFLCPGWQCKLAVFAVVLPALAAWWALHLPCPVRALTGCICPGCGMGHALRAVLQGDWRAAWQAHPMVFALPLLGLCAWRDGKVLPWRAANAVLLAMLAAGFAANWCLQCRVA